MPRAQIHKGPTCVLNPTYVAAHRASVTTFIDHLESYRLLRDTFETSFDECRESALRLRSLTGLQKRSYEGDLKVRFRALEGAFEDFVTSSGGASTNRWHASAEYFEQCLQALRRSVGLEVAWMCWEFDLEVDARLADYFPSDYLFNVQP